MWTTTVSSGFLLFWNREFYGIRDVCVCVCKTRVFKSGGRNCVGRGTRVADFAAVVVARRIVWTRLITITLRTTELWTFIIPCNTSFSPRDKKKKKRRKMINNNNNKGYPMTAHAVNAYGISSINTRTGIRNVRTIIILFVYRREYLRFNTGYGDPVHRNERESQITLNFHNNSENQEHFVALDVRLASV